MKENIKTIGISFLFTLLTFAILFGVAVLASFLKTKNLWLGNFTYMLVPIIISLGVIFYHKKYNNLVPKQDGFSFYKFWKNLFFGVFLTIGTFTVILLVSKFAFNLNVVVLPLQPNFLKPLLSIVTTTFLIGVWEELFFRRFFFVNLLHKKFNVHSAAIISAVFFSILHFSSFDMSETSWWWYFGIVIMGYILALLYYISKSIWLPISIHFLWDFMAELLDNKTNKVGLITIQNYSDNAKLCDNIMVAALALALVLLLWLMKSDYFSLRKKLLDL